ncbi:GNAT family N-acetyltransferase [Oceanibium sediminis]|uniref:GNAT family N-acetyltransferase n=1 Tax=Oceanibium sediminis TaxID=2026339 RepID=UPI000DD3BF46|nr:GNAT family protein [Oceanibium sediminis]
MTDTAPPLAHWRPPHRAFRPLRGRYAELSFLTPADAGALHAAFGEDTAIWDYMAYGPFADADTYADWIARIGAAGDPVFYCITDIATGLPGGVASYLRITPLAGSIEVGHINFAPHLQRTRAASEAMYLMMRQAFDLGYRRYEWKCDARNLGSRRAAQRYGFSFEGVHRQAGVVKGRNRDTAWFSLLDREWPAVRAAFESWLAEDNFEDGVQRRPLSALTAPLLAAGDPALG